MYNSPDVASFDVYSKKGPVTETHTFDSKMITYISQTYTMKIVGMDFFKTTV